MKEFTYMRKYIASKKDRPLKARDARLSELG